MSSRRSCSCPCAHGIGLRDLENGLYKWDSPVGASVGGEGHVRVGCLALQTHKPLSAVGSHGGRKGLTCAVWIRFMHIVAPSMPEGPDLSCSLLKAPKYSWNRINFSPFIAATKSSIGTGQTLNLAAIGAEPTNPFLRLTTSRLPRALRRAAERR